LPLKNKSLNTPDMRIDAHQHFWKYHAQQQQWIDHHMSAIKRDFLPITTTK